MHSRWKIELLGWLRASRDELVVSRFRTHKSAVLLAYLAYFQNRSHTREALAEMLWPNDDPAATLKRLSQALASLRRQLEPPGVPAGSVLISDRFSIRLNPIACYTDVEEFKALLEQSRRARNTPAEVQALSKAMTLYRGELLPTVFEEWTSVERADLALLHEEAVERLRMIQGRSALPGQTEEEVRATNLSDDEQSPSAPRLPLQFTHFFGRGQEIQTVRNLLLESDERGRLCTLLGPAGCGKTRLAIEVGTSCVQSFEGQVYFVPLADLTEAHLIPLAILKATGFAMTEDERSLEKVVARLGGQKTLLILDNFEHIVEEGAAILHRLRKRLPDLSCLVTSRHVLRLEGEQEVLVEPLAVPETSEVSLSQISAYPSVQIYVDRAQKVRPDFQLTARNASSVAQICRMLEGIPLAIELAAGWAQTLSVFGTLEQLKDRLDFLVSRRRDIPARHATVRAAIDYSYSRLSPELQALFLRLSVFQAGWTLDAATELWRAFGPAKSCHSVLDMLAQLRNQSMIHVRGPWPSNDVSRHRAENRFSMLETLREFAAERLSPEETQQLRKWHAEYFDAFLKKLKPPLTGPDPMTATDQIGEEHENIRLALTWCHTSDASELGLSLCSNMGFYWSLCGLPMEGETWLKAFLDQAKASTYERGRALLALGNLLTRRMQCKEAGEFLYEGLEIFTQLGVETEIVNAHLCLAHTNLYQRQEEQALWHANEANLILERIAEPSLLGRLNSFYSTYHKERDEVEPALRFNLHALDHFVRANVKVGIGWVLTDLALLEHERGNLNAAQVYVTRALDLWRRLGNKVYCAGCQYILGCILIDFQKYELAAENLRKAFHCLMDFDAVLGVRCCIVATANLEIACQRPDLAAMLIGAADAINPYQRGEPTDFMRERVWEAITHVLPESEAEAHRNCGRSLSFAEATHLLEELLLEDFSPGLAS